MTTILQNGVFAHDLDPNYSSGVARASNGGKVTLTFSSDNSSNAGTGINDTNALAIAYTGPSYLTSLTFNPTGTAATGGNTTGGNNGLDNNNIYFSNIYPGMVFLPSTKAFTFGTGSLGLTASDVTAAFSNLAPLPSNQTNQYWTMALSFPNTNFVGGKILRFTVGRGLQHSSSVQSAGATVVAVPGPGPTGGTTAPSYSADLFGGSVLLPDGTGTGVGMSFSGTLGDGSTFSGTINNRVGVGYSRLDGYGFINAEAAVQAAIP